MMSARFRLAHLVLAALIAVGIGGAVTAMSAPALAHHGWSWAEEKQSILIGTIKSISMDPPHPSLVVTGQDGIDWQIELGNPGKTERAGFTADSAKPGDSIAILGNRSRDPDEKLMKAVRITIDGRNYDMYPERIETN